MIYLVLGGFPCTSFSIARKKNRINKVDFTADEFVRFHNSDSKWYRNIFCFEKYIGNKLNIADYKLEEGFQLFFNCVAAVDRVKEQHPCGAVYYLFENVSSMQKDIKKVLTDILAELYGGVATEINSALVSAQTRKRIYFTNFGEIPSPADKGINIRDILVKDETTFLKYAIRESKTVDKQIPRTVEKYGFLPEIFNPYNARIIRDKSPTLSTGSMVTSSCAICKLEQIKNEMCGEKDCKYLYEVSDGKISYKGEKYPVHISGGNYVIRSATVNECKKLQTVPEWYEFPVSEAQARKMLGNGWTCDVISYILSFVPNIHTDDIKVCSLYDGMSGGRIALINLGLENRIKYYEAYEIDKYAIITTQHNFPDTVQRGNAFAIREDGWRVEFR